MAVGVFGDAPEAASEGAPLASGEIVSEIGDPGDVPEPADASGPEDGSGPEDASGPEGSPESDGDAHVGERPVALVLQDVDSTGLADHEIEPPVIGEIRQHVPVQFLGPVLEQGM